MLNRHATAVVLGDRGVLIEGPSGAGKSTLALELLAHCREMGVFARLISDDQVYLEHSNGRAVASAPAPIAGLAEVFGAGPAHVHHEPQAVIDLLVRLVDAHDAPRLREASEEVVDGVHVPCLELGRRNAQGGVLAVASRLTIAPFC